MSIAVIIVACLIARPTQCETIPTGIFVRDEAACTMSGEQWTALRLREDWMLKAIRCEAGFVDEDNG